MQFRIGLNNVNYCYSVGFAYGVERLFLVYYMAVIKLSSDFDFIGGNFHLYRRIRLLSPDNTGTQTQESEDYAEKSFQKRLFL